MLRIIMSGERGLRLSEPDWCHALINAERAFLAVSDARVFWVAAAGQTRLGDRIQ